MPGEDDKTCSKHVKIMKEEMKKKDPSIQLLKEGMKRTVTYRQKFCSEHSTKEVLDEFPVLKKSQFVSTPPLH